jgi:hypothetical protein
MEVPDDVAQFMRDRDRSKHERAKEEESRVIAEFEAKARAERDKTKRLKDAARKRKMQSARHESKQFRGTQSNTPIAKDQKPGSGVKRRS